MHKTTSSVISYFKILGALFFPDVMQQIYVFFMEKIEFAKCMLYMQYKNFFKSLVIKFNKYLLEICQCFNL